MQLDLNSQNFLNNLIEITLKICNTYDELNYAIYKHLEINDILSRLKALKNEENNFYKYLNEHILECEKYYVFFINNKMVSNNEKDFLTYMRILTNLERTLLLHYANTPTSNIGVSIDDKSKNYLTDNGFTEETSKTIVVKIRLLLQDSLALAFHNLHLKTINTTTNENVRKIYLKRIIKQAILRSGEFEEELINHNFSFLTNYLNSKLNEIITVNGKRKQGLINIILEEDMLKIIKGIMLATNSDEYDELFMNFRSYILHINEEELNRYKAIITNESLTHSYDPKKLLNEIDYFINLRKQAKGKQK